MYSWQKLGLFLIACLLGVATACQRQSATRSASPSARTAKGWGSAPIAVTDDSFERVVLEEDRVVLVDFWAAWCGACRELAPTVDRLARSGGDDTLVVKLNVDHNPVTASRYDIQALPTLVIFYDGEEVDRIIGVASQEYIEQRMARWTNMVSQVDRFANDDLRVHLVGYSKRPGGNEFRDSR